ncbi:peptidase [Roseateles chitinivorans]|uniref:peptidase n=1 Tax=Roseateles chitinivorans TaxID=2917965 RepID=UPI003D666844
MQVEPLIHIFQAGRRTTMAGSSLEFSEADLQATAKAYDPATHETPICIGHPKHNLPAYGWLASVEARDGGLYAKPHQVDPEFAEMVRKGAFKKVSIAFYDKTNPANPVPGVYYPRHVGFLGAQPPAVKGLKQVEFGEADEQLVFAELDFSERGLGVIADSFRRLREFFISQFGLEKADQALPGWQVDVLQDVAREPDDKSSFANPAFSEGNPTTEDDVSAEQISKLQADLVAANKRADDAEAANRAAQQAATANARQARHDDNLAFAEGLIKGDQLLPADRYLVVAALDAANGDQAEKAIEFGEGDQKKSLGEALRGLLAKLPKHALTDKHLAVKGERGAASADDGLEFGEHTRVDNDSLVRHREALALSEEKGIPYIEAARQIAGR